VATFEAVGPAFALDGPPPVAPPHSLLNTEGVVVERDATRILNGVNVWAYPTGCSSLWEPCSDGTFRVKVIESNQPTARFDAFVVYKSVVCSSIGMRDPHELFDRAEAVLEATVSAGIERALAGGVDLSSNPFFGDATVDDLTGGTAVSSRAGLAMLEKAIGATCRQGMIHLTPAVLSSTSSEPIESDPASEMGPLLTINGTPVVSGMGYQDIDTPYLSTPGATEDWVFATGPVRVYMGPMRLDKLQDSLEPATNVLTYIAERYVVALWDGVLQAAALVDWST
jgi:hypothetical protein